MKSFNETIESIETLINKDKFNFLNPAYTLMEKDIEDAKKDNQLTITKKEIEIVDSSFKEIVFLILTNQDLTFSEMKKMKDFALFAFNWNSIIRNKEIGKEIEGLKNLIELYFNSFKLADKYNELLTEHDALRQFDPPSYEIKKEYLELLEDRYSRGGKK